MNCRQKYYNDISIYQIGQYLQSDCSDITFYNTGSNNVSVNGVILLPNQTIQFNCNQNEIDVTKYYFFFIAGTGANQLTVIRKLYVD